MDKSYNFQIESFGEVYDELLDNYKLYNEEVDEYKRPLKLNKNGYLKYEELGLFKMFTIRNSGELIGQCGVYITPSMFTGEIVANEDFIFIKKEHRGTHLVYEFIKMMEKYLKENGVNEVLTTSRIENKTYLLMERLGYKKIAYQCSKRFEV